MRNEVSGHVQGTVVQAGRIGEVNFFAAPVAPTALDGVPPTSGTFAGRVDQLAELAAGTGLAVVSGLGGVGKTQLALRYAHQHHFPGGKLYYDLHGYDADRRVEPTDVLSAFLRGLGVRDEDIPPREAERASLFRSLVANRDLMLVVLDNASSTEQVQPLLVDRHRVVVVSRHTLTSLHGQELELGVLNPAESVELVRDPELAELCGHLPLALQIMAALVKTDPKADWAAELREAGLDVLDDGDSRAVHATFSLSYRSLDADQQRMFRLLALHPGEVDAESAAALADLTTARARKLLRDLHRAHLLEERYRCHDLVRLYAVRCLEEESAADRTAARERLIAHYARTAAKHAKGIQNERCDPDALAWMDEHYATVLAVAATARDQDVVAIAESMYRYLSLRKHMTAWFALQQLAVDSARRLGDPRSLAKMINRLGTIHRQTRQFDQAIAHCQEALRIHEELGEQIGIGAALIVLASTYRDMGRPELALPHCERSLRIRREVHDPRGLGISLTNIGATYRELGELDEAITYYEEALDLQQRLGHEGGEAITWYDLGKAYHAKGMLDRAVEYLQSALRIHRRRDDRVLAGVTLKSLGSAYRDLHRVDEALDAYRESLAAFEEIDAEHDARQVRELIAELPRPTG
jgi:tetratricopeptide (TPR) repeat protein